MHARDRSLKVRRGLAFRGLKGESNPRREVDGTLKQTNQEEKRDERPGVLGQSDRENPTKEFASIL